METTAQDEPTLSLGQFIERHGILAYVKRVDANPNAIPGDWESGSRHWEVTIACGKRTLDTYFSQGSAHTDSPTVNDVLGCLADDSAGWENAPSFEEWASEYGFEENSRKAERTYRIIGKQAAALRDLLGSLDYETLLWNVERE